MQTNPWGRCAGGYGTGCTRTRMNLVRARSCLSPTIFMTRSSSDMDLKSAAAVGFTATTTRLRRAVMQEGLTAAAVNGRWVHGAVVRMLIMVTVWLNGMMKEWMCLDVPTRLNGCCRMHVPVVCTTIDCLQQTNTPLSTHEPRAVVHTLKKSSTYVSMRACRCV